MTLARRLLPAALLLAPLLPAPLAAQVAPAPAPAESARPAPKLIVVISVDQFSANLFDEYRGRFTGGLARMASGGVFPSGYQSHAATETCPGHSTILTGARPARTGIVANTWFDLDTAREDKKVYCAEDESVPGSTSSRYTVSDKHLKVPTLGEWMKGARPGTRVVSVAGKDRAAVMMGGHDVDQLWWWDGKAFVTYAGREAPQIVGRVNGLVSTRIAEEQPAMTLPAMCERYDRAIPIGGGNSVGTGRFARKAGDERSFRASPEFDEAVASLAAGFATEMKLGQGADTDLLIVGLSATDYVGHGYGTEGTEMCLQLLSLDQTLGKLFAVLDSTGVDYAVVLTADHGGHDLTERSGEQAVPASARVDAALEPGNVGKGIAADMGLARQPLYGGVNGDIWIDPALTPAQHKTVLDRAVRVYGAHPQVAAVFTRDQVLATPSPTGTPDEWTLLERARASYDPERSGDLLVALKPHILPIERPGPGYVATHGSFWNYDRRVPILFWRKGMTGFEQPSPVETVDIAPTIAALIGIAVPVEIDGRCLDLDPGAGTTCR